MKVCMVAYTFYESDNRVRRYAETLAARGDLVDAIVLRMPGQKKYEIINNVRIYRIQKRKINEKGVFSYFFKILLFLINSSLFITLKHIKNNYSLFHIHSIPDFQVFAAWFPKLTGSKIILDIHDIVPELYISKFKTDTNSLLFKFLLIIEKISIAFCDHVIIANHLWYQKLISRSVTEEKCAVIMNYPDPKIFHKKDISKQNGKFLLLYPGTLNWHQGADIAIKAVSIVKTTIPNVMLHFYGDGNDKTALLELVCKLKLEQFITFLAEQPLEKIAEIMQTADLGIEPKRSTSFSDEAFSTKILEFMMLGVPVIASDTTIHKYYFNDSQIKLFKSGDDKDLAEKIMLLYKNRIMREKLVAEADKIIDQYNWDYKKQEYFNLVDSLVENLFHYEKSNKIYHHIPGQK